MSTLTKISEGLQDKVYTSLLDSGLAPGQAQDMSRDPSEFIGVDEYAEALAADDEANYEF